METLARGGTTFPIQMLFPFKFYFKRVYEPCLTAGKHCVQCTVKNCDPTARRTAQREVRLKERISNQVIQNPGFLGITWGGRGNVGGWEIQVAATAPWKSPYPAVVPDTSCTMAHSYGRGWSSPQRHLQTHAFRGLSGQSTPKLAFST